jgi:hypothetical protein
MVFSMLSTSFTSKDGHSVKVTSGSIGTIQSLMTYMSCMRD